jgi:DNA invertase Pin-like site-specific DNA recombinase
MKNSRKKNIRGIKNCSPERDICIKKQKDILENKDLDYIYIDEISDKKSGKEAYYNLMEILIPNDIVIICKLSRIAETFEALSNIIGIFKDKKIELNVLELGEITKENNLIHSDRWVNALCSFEKDIKYEKICAGHLKSKINHQSNNVTSSGRPEKYSKKQLSEALKMKDRYTIREIASLTGISKNTLLRASKKMQL